MKVEVLKVFYDNNGLHKVGDITDVDFFNSEMMKKVEVKPSIKSGKKKTEKTSIK